MILIKSEFLALKNQTTLKASVDSSAKPSSLSFSGELELKDLRQKHESLAKKYESDIEQLRTDFSRAKTSHVIPQSLPSEATLSKGQLDKAIADLEHSLDTKFVTEYQYKKLESSIRAEVQSHVEAAKVEHKKQLELLQNDLDQKLEKLRFDAGSLIHRKDPTSKAAYLSSQVNAEAPSVQFKEELGSFEQKFNLALLSLEKRIESSHDSKAEEVRISQR